MERHIDINAYDYDLPEERIAKFPLAGRSDSKLLIWRGGSETAGAGAPAAAGAAMPAAAPAGEICEARFAGLGDVLPPGELLVFNNTKVIRARIVMHKPSGARIEVFCLEPHAPADYERAFAATGSCEWTCMVGNLKKWKESCVEINFEHDGCAHYLRAWFAGSADASTAIVPADIPAIASAPAAPAACGGERLVRFEWSAPLSFGELLEHLGRIPIPPYLNRDSEAIDLVRYQTVYSRFEGSVAAPTAGLHFTAELIESMRSRGFGFEEITLHVGAGTFLPVKEDDAARHAMHTEHFEVRRSTVAALLAAQGRITAVGTTSVRTLESLTALAWRIRTSRPTAAPQPATAPQPAAPQTPDLANPVGQWELYDIPAGFSGREALETLLEYMTSEKIDRLQASTRIMIAPPDYCFRIVRNIITNFHQPHSTLLLLVAAYAGEQWRMVYDYALGHDFRFLSYGDSSLLMR